MMLEYNLANAGKAVCRREIFKGNDVPVLQGLSLLHHLRVPTSYNLKGGRIAHLLGTEFNMLKFSHF